ncbi:MAG: formate/nitrite transporter family protein, partial [Boseongicola sp.]
IWPISAFVLMGFEHSIANLFLLPQGALAGGIVPLTGALANLFWVTIGNIIGGSCGVFLAYRFAYRPGR